MKFRGKKLKSKWNKREPFLCLDKIKPIIRKFLQEHDFTTYIKEVTMNNELIYDYNKFENDLLKAIEDGYS